MNFYIELSNMVAEWNIENTRIVTELFVKQVRAGNRPNTHLTSNAYDEVVRQFKIRTGLEYTNDQLKNKWDKLRGEYGVFKKLKLKETGAGWYIECNTMRQDAKWWKKAKIVSFHPHVVHIISFFILLVVDKCCLVCIFTGHSRLLQVQEAWTSQ